MKYAYLPLLALLLTVTGLDAQSWTVVARGTMELKEDGKRPYGQLNYRVELPADKSIGDNTYDYSGETRVRAKVYLTAETERGYSKRNVRVAILLSDLNKVLLPQSPWQMVDRSRIELDWNQTYQREFRTAHPGEARLKLPVSIWNEKDDGPAEQDASWSRTAVADPYVNITGFRLIGLPSEEDRDWEKLKSSTDLDRLATFALRPPTNPAIAAAVKEKVNELAVRDYKRQVAGSTKTEASMQDFLRRFGKYAGRGFDDVDERVRVTRGLLEPSAPIKPIIDEEPEEPVVPANTRLQQARTQWSDLTAARDTAGLREFRQTYADLLPVHFTGLDDSLTCWAPPQTEILGRKGGRERIRLHNFLRPAYYDIYAGRIDIDDELLRQDHLLSVRIAGEEKVVLTVADKGCPGKILPIPLDNLMSAGMTADTTAGRYTFTFAGGRPPYRLRLYPDGGDGTDWVREGIAKTTITIHRDSLLDAGLRGPYLAEAYSDGSDSPVSVAGGALFLPAPKWPGWVVPALLLLAVGALGLVLLFVLRRGNSQRKTIFDEA